MQSFLVHGVIVDWKTCQKDDKDDGAIKLPFDLKNSEHSRYCLQMNLYRRMVEREKPVNKMFIMYLEGKDRIVEVERIENLDKIINFINLENGASRQSKKDSI